GVHMLVEPRGDGLGCAVCDDGVDQPVAAGLAHVVVAESQPPPVVDVVTQAQVEADGLAADAASFIDVVGEYHFVFGGQEHRVADQVPRRGGVLGGGQIRVGARAPLR